MIKPYIGPDWPNDKNNTFNGKVTIRLECSKPTNKIVFHSKDLNLISIGLTRVKTGSDERQNVSFTWIWPDEETDFVTVITSQACQNEYVYYLTIDFSGKIVKELFGFYQSNYADSTNKMH